MSNPKVEYNNYIRANLPAGITYDSTRNQYVTGNGKRFVTYKEAKWYLDYIIKFGYSPISEYAANGFEPKFVADFVENYFRVDGDTSSFAAALEPTATTNGTMVDSDGLLKWRPHNLVPSSDDFSHVSWAFAGITPTVDTVTCTRNLNNVAFLSAPISAQDDQTYTSQVDIEVTSGQWVTLEVWSGIAQNGVRGWFDLQNGVKGTLDATSGFTAVSHSIEAKGDGVYRIKVRGTRLAAGNVFWALRFVDGDGAYNFTATDGNSAKVTKACFHRSDLGGMVDNPDTGDSYVPTTTGAVYLPRRNHHIYNGSAWVNEGILVEPSTQTNKPHGAYSSPKNGTTNVTGLTISDDAGVGFTGAGTGPRVTGSGSSGTQRMHLGQGDATYKSTAQVYIAKSSTHKYYQIINSSDANAYVNFDINDGSLGNVGSAWSADGIVSVVDHETFYELIVNDTVASSVPRYLYFVDSKTASWAASSATSDYGDIPYIGNIHQSGADNTFPALPIICTGAQVARAGEQLVIPHENISWPVGDELSIHVKFLATYADDGGSFRPLHWASASSSIRYYIDTASGTGQVKGFQFGPLASSSSLSGASVYSPGINVPMNVASRHAASSFNIAVDGSAGTENNTNTGFPDLETANLQLAYTGGSIILQEVSLWDVGIGDAGTEDATA